MPPSPLGPRARAAALLALTACAPSASVTRPASAPTHAQPTVSVPAPGANASAAPAPAPRVSHADPTFLERWAATGRFGLGAPAELRLDPARNAVLFLRSGPRTFVRDLYELDLRTGAERVLLTAAQLLGGAEERLSPEERARRERMRLAARGITSYALSPDGATLLVPLSGRLFLVERATGRARELPTRSTEAAIDARFSPDGARVAAVRGGVLYVTDVATGEERAVSPRPTRPTVTYGLPEFIAQEEMDRDQGYWFAPDGASVVFQQTDTAAVEQLHIADSARPEVTPEANRYPRAGRTNAIVRLGIASATARPAAAVAAGDSGVTWVNWDRARYPYLATVRWSRGAPLTLVVQNRAQSECAVLAVEPRTGAVRPLLTETDAAWTELDQSVPRWLPDGSGFLWSADRDGARVLELRGRDGARLAAVTAPALGYRRLVHVDARGRVAYVTGGAEPSETHVFRVAIPAPGTVASAPVQLTRERGEHDALFAEPREDRVAAGASAAGAGAGARPTTGVANGSPASPSPSAEVTSASATSAGAPGDAGSSTSTFTSTSTSTFTSTSTSTSAGVSAGAEDAAWIHFASTLESAPRWTVERAGAGPLVIRSVAEDPGLEPRVELLTVGERAFRAAVVRPRQDFDPTRRYPVIVNVYGGPGSRMVTAARQRYLLAQWMADHGFVVVSIDGRGTPYRGREWSRALRGQLGEVPLADQAAGLAALGARLPELDLARVGVFGWSFGGYLSALAVARRPDVFHVAVAGAPVADWRDYDTHYTERYLGLPDERREDYERASLLTHAAEMTRPLLIVHGTADDNVYFAHGLRLSDALFRAGRPHQFLPLSSHTHMVADPTVVLRLYDRIMALFEQHLGGAG